MTPQRTYHWLAFAFSSLVLCAFAFRNGYPLVYSDTGTYINSGFGNMFPDDRPVFYGLFLRHVSLATTLWFPILAQAVILCLLMGKVYRIFLPQQRISAYLVGIALFLISFTGISYYTSLLIPDIFTPIVFLSVVVILFGNLNWKEYLLYGPIFCLSLIVHLSHIPTLVLGLGTMALVAGITRWVRKRRASEPAPLFTKPVTKPLLVVGGLFIFCMLLIPTVNLGLAGKFNYSNGSHAFLMCRFHHINVLEPYLKETCPDADYRLCAHKDSLPWDILWDLSSPLYEEGGWQATAPEWNKITRDILSNPRYLKDFMASNIEGGLRLFFNNHMEEPMSYKEGSAPEQMVHWRYRPTYRAYHSALQQRGKFTIGALNTRIEWAFWVSLAVLLFALIRPQWGLPHELRWIIGFALAYGVMNSLVCASLAVTDTRYPTRFNWIYPWLGILVLLVQAEKFNLPARLFAPRKEG